MKAWPERDGVLNEEKKQGTVQPSGWTVFCSPPASLNSRCSLFGRFVQCQKPAPFRVGLLICKARIANEEKQGDHDQPNEAVVHDHHQKHPKRDKGRNKANDFLKVHLCHPPRQKRTDHLTPFYAPIPRENTISPLLFPLFQGKRSPWPPRRTSSLLFSS